MAPRNWRWRAELEMSGVLRLDFGGGALMRGEMCGDAHMDGILEDEQGKRVGWTCKRRSHHTSSRGRRASARARPVACARRALCKRDSEMVTASITDTRQSVVHRRLGVPRPRGSDVKGEEKEERRYDGRRHDSTSGSRNTRKCFTFTLHYSVDTPVGPNGKRINSAYRISPV